MRVIPPQLVDASDRALTSSSMVTCQNRSLPTSNTHGLANDLVGGRAPDASPQGVANEWRMSGGAVDHGKCRGIFDIGSAQEGSENTGAGSENEPVVGC